MLAEHQRTMLALIKGRPLPDPVDAYAARIMPGKELALLREIAVWWRALTIEGACPSATRLLKRLGLFETCIEQFYRDENVSPYIEKAAAQFLAHMAQHDDPLMRAMIAFEQALTRLRNGEAGPLTVDWDRDPESVFAALDSGAPLPPADAEAVYRLFLTLDGARCERLTRN